MGGYGQPVAGDTAEKLDRRISNYKWFLLIFHIISLFLALATFGVCIWVRFDLDFSRQVKCGVTQ